jgi:hypothetical protein
MALAFFPRRLIGWGEPAAEEYKILASESGNELLFGQFHLVGKTISQTKKECVVSVMFIINTNSF